MVWGALAMAIFLLIAGVLDKCKLNFLFRAMEMAHASSCVTVAANPGPNQKMYGAGVVAMTVRSCLRIIVIANKSFVF